MTMYNENSFEDDTSTSLRENRVMSNDCMGTIQYYDVTGREYDLVVDKKYS